MESDIAEEPLIQMDATLSNCVGVNLVGSDNHLSEISPFAHSLIHVQFVRITGRSATVTYSANTFLTGAVQRGILLVTQIDSDIRT